MAATPASFETPGTYVTMKRAPDASSIAAGSTRDQPSYESAAPSPGLDTPKGAGGTMTVPTMRIGTGGGFPPASTPTSTVSPIVLWTERSVFTPRAISPAAVGARPSEITGCAGPGPFVT